MKAFQFDCHYLHKFKIKMGQKALTCFGL